MNKPYKSYHISIILNSIETSIVIPIALKMTNLNCVRLMYYKQRQTMIDLVKPYKYVKKFFFYLQFKQEKHKYKMELFMG